MAPVCWTRLLRQRCSGFQDRAALAGAGRGPGMHGGDARRVGSPARRHGCRSSARAGKPLALALTITGRHSMLLARGKRHRSRPGPGKQRSAGALGQVDMRTRCCLLCHGQLALPVAACSQPSRALPAACVPPAGPIPIASATHTPPPPTRTAAVVHQRLSTLPPTQRRRRPAQTPWARTPPLPLARWPAPNPASHSTRWRPASASPP